MKSILCLLSLLPLLLTGCVSAGVGVGPDGAGAGVSVGTYAQPVIINTAASPTADPPEDSNQKLAQE